MHIQYFRDESVRIARQQSPKTKGQERTASPTAFFSDSEPENVADTWSLIAVTKARQNLR